MDELVKIIDEFSRLAQESKKIILQEGKEVYETMNYYDKLNLLAYLFDILYEHAKEGGTYRYLLYERLGLDLDSYGILQMCGALEIHNLISGELKDES